MRSDLKSFKSFVEIALMSLLGFALVVMVPVAIYHIVNLAAYLMYITD